MKNVVSSYSDHWLLIIGVIFIACVMFFPGGIWGMLRQFRWQSSLERKPA
jgi:ABC-type branched-subunit amino acid transport system permease subunit